MTDYNDGKWHGWNGGECPVHPKTVVEVRSWAGCSRTVQARLILSWNDDGAQSQPVALRVVKEHKEPREFWIGYNWRACPTEKLAKDSFGTPGGKVIHVREVLA